jgi:FeS assembly protein IscX
MLPHITPGVTAMGLNWNDSQELGELLFEKYDSVNPMTVRFADLRKWVLDLEDFAGKPNASEENLAAIQKAWHEEWKLEYGDD